MSQNPHSNLDARDLWAQAQRLKETIEFVGQVDIEGQGQDLLNMLFETEGLSGPAAMSHVMTMLFRAAQHLQAFDDKLAARLSPGEFEQGAAFADQRARARSNVLSGGRRVTDEEGKQLIGALVERGAVKRLPTGARSKPKPQEIDLTGKKSAPARTGFKLGDL